MGVLNIINLFFRGSEVYMKGKVKDAVSSSKWSQIEGGQQVVGWKVNAKKAKEYLSKHPEVILNSGADSECITFIMQSGMAHYRCELMTTGSAGEGQSALMVYR
jgi:hypothetical protein